MSEGMRFVGMTVDQIEARRRWETAGDDYYHPRGEFSIGGPLWPGISKLTEEMGEVSQVIGKLIGNEGRNGHWDGSNLIDRMNEELGDLTAAIRFVRAVNPQLSAEAIDGRADDKFALFLKWHRETLAKRSAA